jgi:hypothetical protein
MARHHAGHAERLGHTPQVLEGSTVVEEGESAGALRLDRLESQCG